MKSIINSISRFSIGYKFEIIFWHIRISLEINCYRLIKLLKITEAGLPEYFQEIKFLKVGYMGFYKAERKMTIKNWC